ncbi:InlB B-repeat-containing protein [Bifidobacterium boum]|uniref:InlB B-repeat-containing protein n=1 Tax=Bifidobacterium boum TaxID=78343 RepID=UPI003F934901
MGNSHRPWIAGVAVLAMIGSLACAPSAGAAETQPAQDASSQQTVQQQTDGAASEQNGENTGNAENNENTGNDDSADASKPDASDGSVQGPAAPGDPDAGMSLSGSTRTLTAGGMYYTAVSTKSPAGIQPGTYRVSGGKYEYTPITVKDYDISTDRTDDWDTYYVGGSMGTKTIVVRPGQVVENGDASDDDTTWQLVSARKNTGVMTPQGAATWKPAGCTRFSSLSASSPASIKPGIYLVDATASGWSRITVSDYSIGTGESANSRDYDPAYHQHYQIIQVNAGQIVQLDGSINTHWQLLKSLPTGEVLTPQSKVYTKVDHSQFFSNIDVASSPQAGIPAGVYLVSSSQQSVSFSDIKVSDFDANEKNTDGKSSSYRLNYGQGDHGDYALVQVSANQRVSVGVYPEDQSVKWQLVKALPNSGVRVPRKAIVKNKGMYRVGRDISAGMYLVHTSAAGNIKVCDVDRYSNTETDCDSYDSEGPAAYLEIVVKSGQNVYVHCKEYYNDGPVASYWQLLPAPLPVYSVTFNSRGGSKVGTQSVRKGSRVARPKNPARTGYSFRTWTVDAAGRRPYNFNAAVTKNLRLYAQWTARKYTVYFNANGGSVKTRSKTVTYGGKYGSLPSGSRKGYRLSGWWTAKSGGSQVTANTVYRRAGNRTLYARWVNGVPMYRLYNKYTGEHFYTKSVKERDSLVGIGWRYERVGWVAPFSGKPVYRLNNPYAPGGDHHYTMSVKERDALVKAGWVDEHVGWYSGGKVKVLREYNRYARTGTHNYTTDPKEDAALVKAGWRAEGTGWYALR